LFPELYSGNLIHFVLAVGDLQLRAVILHKKVQEDPSTPLQNRKKLKTREEKFGPTEK
jgi:hypothetical protein